MIRIENFEVSDKIQITDRYEYIYCLTYFIVVFKHLYKMGCIDVWSTVIHNNKINFNDIKKIN